MFDLFNGLFHNCRNSVKVHNHRFTLIALGSPWFGLTCWWHQLWGVSILWLLNGNKPLFHPLLWGLHDRGLLKWNKRGLIQPDPRLRWLHHRGLLNGDKRRFISPDPWFWWLHCIVPEHMHCWFLHHGIGP